eukprot:GHVT01015939.1.p2 GENE.GHVT01015939.1~~GHVT01015939.1.p2  ORF type:complete len:104 (-),score=12.41 GHVT01015939.1:430-741(-)
MIVTDDVAEAAFSAASGGGAGATLTLDQLTTAFRSAGTALSLDGMTQSISALPSVYVHFKMVCGGRQQQKRLHSHREDIGWYQKGSLLPSTDRQVIRCCELGE